MKKILLLIGLILFLSSYVCADLNITFDGEPYGLCLENDGAISATHYLNITRDYELYIVPCPLNVSFYGNTTNQTVTNAVTAFNVFSWWGVNFITVGASFIILMIFLFIVYYFFTGVIKGLK